MNELGFSDSLTRSVGSWIDGALFPSISEPRCPMNPMLTLLLASCLSAATLAPPTAAPIGDTTDFTGFVLDKSGELVDVVPVEKSDPRDNVALFGQRPTLLLVSVNPSWNAGEIKNYVKTLKRVDKLAAKWEQSGFEVLCIVPQAWMEQKGKRIALDLVDRAKPDNMSCARLGDWDIYSPFEQPVRDDLLVTRYGTELTFRWAVIQELGAISASGDDVFDKSLEELRKSLKAPEVSLDGSTKRCFSALAEWRLGDAEELLAKLESGAAAERYATEIEELRGRIELAEAYYRRVFCEPLRERGMLAEYVDQLERLAGMFGAASENGTRLRAEAESVRGESSYAASVVFRERYLAMRALQAELEAAVDREYESRAGEREDFDEATYYAAVEKLYPAAIEQLNTYVKEQRESPYYRTIASILMELNEDLTYARRSH